MISWARLVMDTNSKKAASKGYFIQGYLNRIKGLTVLEKWAQKDRYYKRKYKAFIIEAVIMQGAFNQIVMGNFSNKHST